MLLNKQLTSNYQLVELVIPANSPNQKFSFTDQPLLRDKAIEKIECYNFGSVFQSPSGYAVGTPNLNIYVTFATDGGDEFIQNIAAMELNAVSNYAGGVLALNGGFTIGLRKIIFPKSYITYNVSSPTGSPYSFVFGIYYK
jgi:hypothetical protein